MWTVHTRPVSSPQLGCVRTSLEELVERLIKALLLCVGTVMVA